MNLQTRPRRGGGVEWDAATVKSRFASMVGPDVVPMWIGIPVQGMWYRAVPSLFGNGLWLVVVVLLMAGSFNGNGPSPFSLIPLMFILAGLIFSIGELWVDNNRRAHTIYALTKDQAYIVRDGRSPFVAALDLVTTHPITFRRRGDGSGTITFGPRYQSVLSEMIYKQSRRTFSDVPTVDEVFRFVTDAVLRAQASGSVVAKSKQGSTSPGR